MFRKAAPRCLPLSLHTQRMSRCAALYYKVSHTVRRLAQAEEKGGAREEDLLAVQVDACADHVPRRERGPIVVPVPVRMILLAIVAMVAIALRLPPAPITPRLSW